MEYDSIIQNGWMNIFTGRFFTNDDGNGKIFCFSKIDTIWNTFGRLNKCQMHPNFSLFLESFLFLFFGIHCKLRIEKFQIRYLCCFFSLLLLCYFENEIGKRSTDLMKVRSGLFRWWWAVVWWILFAK